MILDAITQRQWQPARSAKAASFIAPQKLPEDRHKRRLRAADSVMAVWCNSMGVAQEQ